MIRGTTAKFKFKVPYDIDFNNDNTYVKAVFWQPGNDGSPEYGELPIIKCIKNETCIWDANNQQIIVTLQPIETARFVDDRKAYTQLSVTTASGFRFASDQQIITVYPIQDDSPLGDIIPTDSSLLTGAVVLDGLEITAWGG